MLQRAPSPSPELETQANISKAERKARHQEANRQLWESADAPEERPLWLDMKEDAAAKSEFKPKVKLLSRKPPPKVASPDISGNPSIKDDDDSEDEEGKKAAESFAERQARAQREREEKQRKYQEVRERLFGSPTPSDGNPQSRASSANGNPSGRNSSRGKGRSRGQREGQGTSSNDQSPARPPQNQKRELFDPAYSPKPNSVYLQKKDAKSSPAPSIPREELPVRAPRGPDGSGRGGFGFGPRGNKTASNS